MGAPAANTEEEEEEGEEAGPPKEEEEVAVRRAGVESLLGVRAAVRAGVAPAGGARDGVARDGVARAGVPRPGAPIAELAAGLLLRCGVAGSAAAAAAAVEEVPVVTVRVASGAPSVVPPPAAAVPRALLLTMERPAKRVVRPGGLKLMESRTARCGTRLEEAGVERARKIGRGKVDGAGVEENARHEWFA